MRELAEAFVTGANEDGHAMDWSPSSAYRLDELCDLFRSGRQRKAVVDSVTLAMGAYLGELIVRNGGGRWTYDEEQRAAAVEMRGHLRCYPHNKVGKRLTIGPDHGLWAFYEHAVTGEVPPGAQANVMPDRP